MNRPVRLFPAAATLALLAACSQNPKVAAVATPTPDTTPTAKPVPEFAGRDTAMDRSRTAAMSHRDSVQSQVNGESNGLASSGLTRWGLAPTDSNALADRLQFDFDRSDLSDDDLAKLEAKRLILAAHPTMTIQIDGNCDERGSDEYNLALGERRAAAAKRWLVAHGIGESRVSIVSYGEEKPLDKGHDESAWAKNRRDGFLVLRTSQ